MIAKYKFQLAQAQLSLPLCLLGLLVGLIASALIILFEVSISQAQQLLWRGAEDFKQLSQSMRITLPISGALLIALMIHFSRAHYRRTGIAYVIHRVHQFYGRIPIGSGLNQFVTAMVALISGFSVGREGPAVHIGAIAATVIARYGELPDNTMKILSCCGIAAGISAIFNTPLAGVVFVLEVVLREYKMHYFLPITIAAITAAICSRLYFGDIHRYAHLTLPDLPLIYYPLLLLFGGILGVVAAAFSSALIKVTALSTGRFSLSQRLMAAGAITAFIGMVVPEAMGGEHHVVAMAVQLSIGWQVLALLLIAKIILTIAAIGLGIPGGLIGPMYGIGALLGGVCCLLFAPLMPSITDYLSLFTAISMTAMMAVCLNAPIAGLLALVELTNNATLILPFLLVTIPAFLLANLGFGTRPLFLRQLDVMQLGYRQPPVEREISKTGVIALMNSDLICIKEGLEHDQQLSLLTAAPHSQLLMPKDGQQVLISLHSNFSDEHSPLSHTVIPGLPARATLAEVYQLLSVHRSGCVYIYQGSPQCPIGVINWASLYGFIRRGEV